MNLATIFLSETVGTAMLLLLGAGVVANNILPKNKGEGTGFLMVNFGWGLAVFAGVLVSYKSGGHLNPAVTLGVAGANAIADGRLGVMVADRDQGTELVPLKQVAGKVKYVPRDHEWIRAARAVGTALGD